MIKTTAMILDELKNYASPKNKLSRMAKSGEIVQIVKGLYETDYNTPPYLLAGSIYGPSYISFDFALSFYGLIPEKAQAVTCATFEKKKKKKYETPFGLFAYQDIPSGVFPLYVRICKEGDYYYRMALPEKALCDKLYTLSSVRNVKELSTLLFEDLRIDEQEFQKLNAEIIQDLSEKYHATNIKKLCSLLRRLK
jgi:hypothetical protein